MIYSHLYASYAATATMQDAKYFTALLYTNKSIFREACDFFFEHSYMITTRIYTDERQSYNLPPPPGSTGGHLMDFRTCRQARRRVGWVRWWQRRLENE